ANHSRFGDLRQLIQRRLNFTGSDILGASQDHVLGSVGNIEKSIIIQIPDIAAAQPIAKKRFSGFFRGIPVSFAHLGSPNTDFPFGIGWQPLALVVGDAYFNMSRGAPGRAYFLQLSSGW